jgi:hypothetical protein
MRRTPRTCHDTRVRRTIGRLLDAVDRIITATHDAKEARAELVRLADEPAPPRLADLPGEEAGHAR